MTSHFDRSSIPDVMTIAYKVGIFRTKGFRIVYDTKLGFSVTRNGTCSVDLPFNVVHDVQAMLKYLSDIERILWE